MHRVVIFDVSDNAAGVPKIEMPRQNFRPFLSWLLDAFSDHQDIEFHFFGHQRSEDVARNYPRINTHSAHAWKSAGKTWLSPLTARLEDSALLHACFSHSVFRKNLVRSLEAATGDIILAAYKDIEDIAPIRFPGDTELCTFLLENDGNINPNIKLTGNILFKKLAVKHLAALAATGRLQTPGSICEIVKYLCRKKRMTLGLVMTDQDWAPLSEPQSLARFVLGTKAETLERLRPLLRTGRISYPMYITVGDLERCRTKFLEQIENRFSPSPVIIRSSAVQEDRWDASAAGRFESVLNVDSKDRTQIASAIERVVNSYNDRNPRNQVLVQEMLTDVALSGVVFTRTLDKGSPYYILNYDDTTSSTKSVTGGHGQELRTAIFYKHSEVDIADIDQRLAKVIQAIKEIEALLDFDALDIEFAVTKDHNVHIFQVRPLPISSNGISDTTFDAQLKALAERIRELQKPVPHLSGRKTIFGLMPDANPAELIGTKPKPLAFSLYRHFITDYVVSTERTIFGYRDARPYPLIVGLIGHPYVDVRVSFNSFTPASLDTRLTDKLIDFYIDQLQTKPHLHDKVEFDVAFTCWFADIDQQMNARLGTMFSSSEKQALVAGLITLTTVAIGRIDADLADIEPQKIRYDEIINTDIGPLQKAFLLMEDSKRLGAGIFARLARSGFVAITILKSFVRSGIIEQKEFDDFAASLFGVTKQFENDAYAVKSGEKSLAQLIHIYGHLRPGTYDITSPAYFEDPDKFIKPIVESAIFHKKRQFEWERESTTRIESAFAKFGMKVSIFEFDKFCRGAIEGREYSKFVYTRSLSNGLRHIQLWAESRGLSRDDAAFFEWPDLMGIRSGVAPDDFRALTRKISEGREKYAVCEAAEMPIMISNPEDVFVFERGLLQPNFVTSKKITSDIVVLTDAKSYSDNVQGKIVLIPRADPGFDWLFAQRISGLITMYGGANSHMAIRSAEQRLPAAIGVGEKLYGSLRGANTISLNCENRTITIIK